MIKISESVPLSQHGTFRVGGPARFFAIAASAADVGEILEFRKSAGELALFVLGGGSNMLFGDAGFPGLVMKMEIGGIVADGNSIVAGAGVGWDELVSWTIARGRHGLENMSGIPGTVGGAVVGNIGAYGREIKDILQWVEVVDSATGELRRIPGSKCQFEYRSSFFKTPVGRRSIVIRAAFALGDQSRPAVEHPDVARYFAQRQVLSSQITPREVREAILGIRAAKLPDISKVGTAGSFFKNPVINAADFQKLKTRFPEMPGFSVGVSDRKIKVPAGWLLDKICGYKGKRWGAVGTYHAQALVLVNFGGATATEVAARAEEMASAVKNTTGIILEREVEYL